MTISQGWRAGKTVRHIRLWLLCGLGIGTAAFVPTRAQESMNQPELLSRVTNAYPVFSPDGSQIAYMSNADGEFDIYVMHLSEHVRMKLTDAPGRDGTPVWSPDGKTIAFQSFRDGHSQIYLMNADGSNQRNISNSAAADEHPFWSADGERIIFCSNRPSLHGEGKENIDIYEMNRDGSDVRRITSTPEIETYASWSPDGKQIVCRRIQKDGNWEVIVMNSDGTNERNLTNSPAIDGWPVWSPDGKRIAFTSEDGTSANLFIMNSDGTNKRQVTDNPHFDDRQASWSPDGKALLFARYTWFRGSAWYESSEILILSVE